MTIETPQSTPAHVTVIADRYVSGSSDGTVCGPLATALVHCFGCDAHFQAGTALDSRRITRGSLERGPVVMCAFVVDLDPLGHVADAAWSAATAAQLAEAIAELGGFAYSTRAGWRLVLQLAAPVVLEGPGAWEQWRAGYRAACDWLEGTWGLVADRLPDPSRLFRLGFVVRDGECQEPRTMGSVERLGAFELPPAGDLFSQRPLQVVGAAPSKPQPRGVSVADDASPERSLIYRLLDAGGHVLRKHAPGRYVIRCPRSEEHSTGQAGDTSTMLFVLEPGATGYGRIVCQHASCSGRDLVALVLADQQEEIERRAVRITATGGESGASGIEITLRIEPLDGAPLPMRYMRFNPHNAGRWGALWEAADVADPEDFDPTPNGDLGAALGELRGRVVTLELAAGVVRRILAPTKSEGAAA